MLIIFRVWKNKSMGNPITTAALSFGLLSV